MRVSVLENFLAPGSPPCIYAKADNLIFILDSTKINKYAHTLGIILHLLAAQLSHTDFWQHHQ